MRVATFSIVGRSPDGLLGVAVSSKVLAVGAHCPFVAAGSVAIACQAYLNPYLGLELRSRAVAGEPLDAAWTAALAADPSPEWRQLLAVAPTGEPRAHTGEETDPWAGHLVGTDCAAAGNLLKGPETVSAMVRTFEATPDLELPARLMGALLAGQDAGGDRRGRQSAALLVAAVTEVPYVDLRVDDHADPVAELARVLSRMSPDDLERARRTATTRTPRSETELRARQESVRAALAEQEAAT
jgi:uncharacterized Ntn-hydrolase superfamily protein